MSNTHDTKAQMEAILYSCFQFRLEFLGCVFIWPLRNKEWPVTLDPRIKAFRYISLTQDQANDKADIEFDVDKIVSSFD